MKVEFGAVDDDDVVGGGCGKVVYLDGTRRLMDDLLSVDIVAVLSAQADQLS